MLAIRLQRRGRKGHAQFRVILQDSHRSPSSGKVTTFLGSFNPHTKEAQLDTEKIEFYLKNGAQPSNRAAMLFKANGIKLPKWVVIDDKKQGKVKNPDKFGEDDKPAATESAEAEDSAVDGADDSASESQAGTEEKPETADEPANEAEEKSEAADDEATEESSASEKATEKSDKTDSAEEKAE